MSIKYGAPKEKERKKKKETYVQKVYLRHFVTYIQGNTFFFFKQSCTLRTVGYSKIPACHV